MQAVDGCRALDGARKSVKLFTTIAWADGEIERRRWWWKKERELVMLYDSGATVPKRSRRNTSPKNVAN